jgi:hypothetical protein
MRIDLGCGTAKRPGFIGVDRRNFDGVADLTKSRWLFDQDTLGGVDLLPVGERDCTHADKPVSEMFYFYLKWGWRELNAPERSHRTCTPSWWRPSDLRDDRLRHGI